MYVHAQLYKFFYSTVTGLSALNVTTNYITLSWNLPQNTDNINGYFIYAENDDDNVNETIYDVVDQFMIEGLETYSSYKACVVPLVFEGNGTENCITVQTSEAGTLIIIMVINSYYSYLYERKSLGML